MTLAAEGTAPVVAYLESSLGLSFTGPRRARLLKAIDEQRAAAGQSPEAFLESVSRPGQAFDRLVAEVTVGETYFFRDRAQCDLLRTTVLPELAGRLGREQRTSLWSAGCASGEEAVTLAALADEVGIGDRCDIVGSDASSRAIAKARHGVYGKWSMRSTTPGELVAHFVEDNGRFHVAERLRRQTRFVQRNLLDGPPPPGRFDVILCRNLLIYLTPQAVQRVAEVLAAALTPAGWLITAAGDPLLHAGGLELVRTPSGLAYRGARRWSVPDAGSPQHPRPARRPSSQPPAPRARRAPAAATVREPPARRAVPVPPDGADEPAAAALAARVRTLGDAGRLEEACAAAAEAVQAHPVAVQLQYLAAAVSLAAGRLEAAAAAAARAVYLRPDLPAAHVLLGQVEHARGNTDRARRSFRNGARLLAAAPDDAPVELVEDVPAGHLAAVAETYLAGSRRSS